VRTYLKGCLVPNSLSLPFTFENQISIGLTYI